VYTVVASLYILINGLLNFIYAKGWLGNEEHPVSILPDILTSALLLSLESEMIDVKFA
jgi:hypothetical protein